MKQVQNILNEVQSQKHSYLIGMTERPLILLKNGVTFLMDNTKPKFSSYNLIVFEPNFKSTRSF